VLYRTVAAARAARSHPLPLAAALAIELPLALVAMAIANWTMFSSKTVKIGRSGENSNG
jgi:hypothetical protein